MRQKSVHDQRWSQAPLYGYYYWLLNSEEQWSAHHKDHMAVEPFSKDSLNMCYYHQDN